MQTLRRRVQWRTASSTLIVGVRVSSATLVTATREVDHRNRRRNSSRIVTKTGAPNGTVNSGTLLIGIPSAPTGTFSDARVSPA